MSNKPTPADFSPTVPDFPVIGQYQPIYGKFDLTTYIQGASDYEIMAFLVQCYNATLKGYSDVTKLSKDTVTAYNQLQTWVNTWFNKLDVQQEINNKLQSMYEAGTLSNAISQSNTIPPAVSQYLNSAEGTQNLSNVTAQKIEAMAASGDLGTVINNTGTVQSTTTNWLQQNVTPTGSSVMLDKSLTIEGAAADSKATGNSIDSLKDDLSESITEISDVVGLTKKVVTTANLIFGHINSEGYIKSNNNKNVCFNEKLIAYKYSTVRVDSGYKYQIGLYDINTGNFIRRITWLNSDEVYVLDDDYKIIVEISDINESVLSDFSISEHLHFNLIQPTNNMAFINGKNIKLAYPIGTTIDLTPSDVSYYRYAISDCEQNDVFIINAKGGVNPRVWGFVDKDNKLLSVADYETAEKQQVNLKIIAPENSSKIIVNDQETGGICLICDKVRSNRILLNDMLNDISKLELDVSNTNNGIKNLEDNIFYNTENLSNIVDVIGMDKFSKHTVTVVKPWKYTAWSFIGATANKLVCLYSRGNAHEDSNGFDVYVKTSTNGVIWSREKVLFNEHNVRENITGKGFDREGNLFVWLRKGPPGHASTVHELWKTTDGETFEKISAPTFPIVCGHIGDIVLQPYTTNLFAFFNTYGSQRSWGILKSTDNGVTWTQTVIESDIVASECPVEISGTFISSGRMIALGRKDVNAVGSTNAMFQMQSSDYGSTWTKQYTNITDIALSTPSIVNTNNGHLNLFYFERGAGKLRLRQNNWSDVWDNPANWSESEVVATGSTNIQDAGNVNACAFNSHLVATYYSGDSTDTGIYSVIV